MKSFSKNSPIVMTALVLLLIVVMVTPLGRMVALNAPIASVQAAPLKNVVIVNRSLTLVPEGVDTATGCMAPTHLELIWEPALMSIIEGLPQASLEPGMYLEWETPSGMQFVDKDGFGRDLQYLTRDDFAYLDAIRIDMSPWNKAVVGLLAQQVSPEQKVFLYWHSEGGAPVYANEQ